MSDEVLSSGFSRNVHGIPSTDFAMILRVPRKSPSKPKRKARKPTTAFQIKLAELLEAAGLAKSKDFEARSEQREWRIPASTLEDLLFTDVNPRIKTVEGVAYTLRINPLSLMQLLLDEPPEDTEADFSLSPLAIAWGLYRQMGTADTQDRERVNRAIARLVEDLEEVVARSKRQK